MTKQTSEKKTRGTGGRPVIDTERRTHVGQVIRKYRTAAGMDQAELASKLGYSKTAIGNWELGLTRPDIDNVPRLCKELNIPVTELLDMEPETALPAEDKRFLETLHQLDKFDRNTVWQIMDRLLFQQDSKEKARLVGRICRCASMKRLPLPVSVHQCSITQKTKRSMLFSPRFLTVPMASFMSMVEAWSRPIGTAAMSMWKWAQRFSPDRSVSSR